MALHPKLLEASHLFNEHKFWEAHEALEIPWREDRTPAREFYQGLIHCAAALHHWRLATEGREGRRGDRVATPAQCARHVEGARGQWETAQRKLAKFAPRRLGVDVDAFLEGVRAALAGIEDGEPRFDPGKVPRLDFGGE